MDAKVVAANMNDAAVSLFLLLVIAVLSNVPLSGSSTFQLQPVLFFSKKQPTFCHAGMRSRAADFRNQHARIP